MIVCYLGSQHLISNKRDSFSGTIIVFPPIDEASIKYNLAQEEDPQVDCPHSIESGKENYYRDKGENIHHPMDVVDNTTAHFE